MGGVGGGGGANDTNTYALSPLYSHRCLECPGQPSNPATKGKKQSKKKSTHYCQTCMEDVPVAETYAMSCGHSFCVDCWGGFLENALMDGPRCVYQKCPEFGCNELVTEKEVSILCVCAWVLLWRQILTHRPIPQRRSQTST